jgi:hypothetical protein
MLSSDQIVLGSLVFFDPSVLEEVALELALIVSKESIPPLCFASAIV